ncbi:polymer-forming cytoskeletal protein [Paenibacillus sp. GSMTC-2017]|uniref:bactofilin family protein n=1 Tax=Paenibacillus sp. GSMTC-2017 TaxID=2794350 RepID=UPI0018DA0CDC|nr:polymer-forming cytoskeletal protein [Paenibacillus sp. GSMTC-2017]MBH5319933.1 polymer-forming cytoskeletal protein [Paenibacillus sp. GSMTC-2017]
MFKNKNGSKINPDSTDTLIGEGTVFEGKIKSEASIRIEGKVIGDIISSGDIVIGEKGCANSNITARDLVLAGNLNGDARVTGKLTICSSGILNGNLTAQSLIIEPGGIFNGSSKMTASNTTPSSQAQKELKATS